MDERLNDIFAACLQRIETGATLEECLAAHPAERGALEPLWQLAGRLQALPRPAPPTAALQAAITGQELSRLQAQRQATLAQNRPRRSRPGPSALLAGVLRALGYRGPLSQAWLRAGVVALVLVVAIVIAAGAFVALRAIGPTPPDTAVLAPATSFELEGTIEAVSEASIVIAGISIDLGPQTVINGTPGIGAKARATGQIQAVGTLLAESVTVTAADQALTATVAATAAPPAATAAPTAAAGPPTAGAPPVPTTPPEPAPATAAPPAPAAAGEPFALLRQLLTTGQSDGRAGDRGERLLERLSVAEQAFAEGNRQRAGDQLRDLFLLLNEEVRAGRVDPGFAAEAQALIAQIGATYEIRAVPDEERRNDDNDDDDAGGRDDDDDD